MKLFAAACMTCRLVRRFVLAFGIGVAVAWQMTGTFPLHEGHEAMMQGFLLVVIIFVGISIFSRMREMRARFRRRA